MQQHRISTNDRPDVLFPVSLGDEFMKVENLIQARLGFGERATCSITSAGTTTARKSQDFNCSIVVYGENDLFVKYYTANGHTPEIALADCLQDLEKGFSVTSPAPLRASPAKRLRQRKHA